MKQLIPQSRIDEAAKEFAPYISWEGKQMRNGFNSGAQFALNEVQPVVCEFAEWAYKNYDYVQRISNKSEWVWKKNNDYFTTQQLIEEFINSKNKENE